MGVEALRARYIHVYVCVFACMLVSMCVDIYKYIDIYIGHQFPPNTSFKQSKARSCGLDSQLQAGHQDEHRRMTII